MLTINNTIDGAIQDIEIKGNTVQDPDNLADIKSVGELQEDGTYKMSILSCGKNLFDGELRSGKYNTDNGNFESVAGITSNTNPILVNSNTSYSINRPTLASGINTRVCYYTKEMTYISSDLVIGNNSFVTPPNTKYINFHIATSSFNSSLQVQIEEGTQATPYEPYQGNKCDILLPCQLEKVGDVADRIICKDGVWGVEKNVETQILDGNENWGFSGNIGEFTVFGHNPGSSIRVYLCDKFKVYPNKDIAHEGVSEGLGQYQHADFYEWRVCISNSKLSSVDVTGFKTWLRNNPTLVKYEAKLPQFIPLPRDIQIALNSFFGTTHIYMESGEVEGTIKCKIPKSLGATVQSLNNKTDILSDRIEAIEGLKDSQNMKYETDKGYLVCKETKNGVIDDLKIEGKTLVNVGNSKLKLNYNSQGNALFEGDNIKFQNAGVGANAYIENCVFKPSTLYTLIVNCIDTTLSTKHFQISNWNTVVDTTINAQITKGINIYTFITSNNVDAQRFMISVSGSSSQNEYVLIDKNVLILEGDHTQNPPSYFEGLMSVGEDVDKIEVLSRKEDGNLFDKNQTLINGYISMRDDYGLGGIVPSDECRATDFIRVDSNTTYTLNNDNNTDETCGFYDATKKCITVVRGNIVTSPSNAKYMRCTIKRSDFEQGFQIVRGTQTTKYTPHQSDKKQILFYNSNGELEPIQELHEWDSIEKHSDNKWYYHKRSGKVVLNGSENWIFSRASDVGTSVFEITKTDYKPTGLILSDKFKTIKYTTSIFKKELEGIYTHYDTNVGKIGMAIDNSKLSTQDVQGFKQWLQANNVTVVYQLAKEEVYELAPLHLDSYANETLILCNSGAISPKMEFSITSHINELVKAYGERVNLLEEKVYQYMVTQNRMQLASTYSADSVTFKVDYFSLCGDEENYDEDLYNLILNNILVGKDNYNYDKMFTIILDYASWNQISWEQFDILVGLMDMQHNPPVEELPPEDVIEEDIIEEETPVE